MQVHLRVYADGTLYDEFAINAFEGCYVKKTNLIHSHHQVIPDQANVHDFVFQVELSVLVDDFSILMHIPMHQSDGWEVVGPMGKYTVGFYCILGDCKGG